MDKETCKKTVYPKEQWGAFHPYQCTKKVWQDGYCKTHHPESVKKRREKSQKAWDSRMQRLREQDKQEQHNAATLARLDDDKLADEIIYRSDHIRDYAIWKQAVEAYRKAVKGEGGQGAVRTG